MFEPAASRFHTLVPTSGVPDSEGAHSYRVLSFSVPRLELVGQSVAGQNLLNAPRLEMTHGQVRVIPPGEAPSTELDISAFAPEQRAVPNRILESSGERVLLMLLESDPPVFAVADRKSKTVVRLQHLPKTDLNSIHLSPGGGVVLAEEIAAMGRPAPKTGRLIIEDAIAGGIIKELHEPRIIGLFFHGMSPTGVALYQDSVRDEFVALGMTFPATPVSFSPLAEFAGPGVFFADD